MLILSREVGEAVIIEDVALTLVRIGENYVEVSLVKTTGGRPVVLTLPHHQYINVCYNAQAVFVATKGTQARLGFEAPPDVAIRRREFWNAR